MTTYTYSKNFAKYTQLMGVLAKKWGIIPEDCYEWEVDMSKCKRPELYWNCKMIASGCCWWRNNKRVVSNWDCHNFTGNQMRTMSEIADKMWDTIGEEIFKTTGFSRMKPTEENMSMGRPVPEATEESVAYANTHIEHSCFDTLPHFIQSYPVGGHSLRKGGCQRMD